MAGAILIDSNVYIALLRQREDPIAVLQSRLEMTNVCCCGVVVGEVMRGVKGKRTRERLLAFFSITIMLPTPPGVWDDAWRLARQLDRRGKVIPLTDIIIATCALRAGAAVMTHDNHFREVPDLEVITP